MNQQGFLKHLLQKPVANLRKPYGTSVRELRRYASFIGTSNQKDLLTDPTGSRRFICIEDEEGEWLTAMEIFNYLQENTRDKLSVNKINWFGRILHKLNVPKKASIRGTLYHVVKLE